MRTGVWCGVVAAKKSKSTAGSNWTWRLAGIALCAFFALGVVTGLSQSGRLLAHRLEYLMGIWSADDSLPRAPAVYLSSRQRPSPARVRASSGAIALVERPDGFYQLDGRGVLRGPIAATASGDLPVLSGPAIAQANARQLINYTAELVRAEAQLSQLVSEMHVDTDGDATIFLERPPLAIVLAPDDVSLELARAARVLALWRGHRELLAAIDMTTPAQAVVRPRAGVSRPGVGGTPSAAGRSVRTSAILARSARRAPLALRRRGLKPGSGGLLRSEREHLPSGLPRRAQLWEVTASR